MDFTREWTAFALEAEYEDFGPGRIVKAHNARLADLTRELEEARANAAAVRELMNVYNLGGWTDAVAPMKRALAAEAQLAERTRERDELKEWSDAAVASCAKHQCSMRDARLRESEARAEAAERQVEKMREALRGRVVTDYFCEQCDRGWMEENVEQHAPGCLAAHQEPKP